tara:strand:- start:116 stop:718 length:603 start_codon:yes stop_codon:yes gene_type:complete
MTMQQLPQEQPPVEEPTRLLEWLTRLVILINGIIEEIFESEEGRIHDFEAGSIADQIPAGVDVPLLVEFGVAQGDAKSRFQMTAAGVITANIAGSYDFLIRLSATRNTASGDAIILAYTLVNGVRVDGLGIETIATNNHFEIEKFSFNQYLFAGDVIEIYIVRDGNGANDGQLSGFTPSLGTLVPVNSAQINLSRTRLVK